MSGKIKYIGFDIDGGDFGQSHNINAILGMLEDLPSNIKFVLFGNRHDYGDDISYINCINSIEIGIQYLNKNKIDVFISTGDTGDVIKNATIALGNGKRLCLPVLLPNTNTLLLDVGANIGCTPKTLEYFAELGSDYMNKTYSINNPKVGLLNVGTEIYKGTKALQNTYKLLSENKTINFIGNIEGYNLYDNSCNVIVCDGLIGNILIKQYETLTKQFNYNSEDYGGSQLLGTDKPVIIGHGNASIYAIRQIILKTINGLESIF